jgi:hypothetical protein
MTRRLLIAATLLPLLSAAAHAQSTFSGPLSPGAFEATLGTSPIADTLRQGEDRVDTSGATTRFTRDPALFEAKQVQIVDAMRRQSPQAAAEVEQLFAQNLLTLVRPELRRMGLDDEDAADMTAVYWIAAWEASNGIVGRKTEPAVTKGARDQIARLMATNPAMGQMGDRERQDLADTMFLQAILAEARMDSAAKAGPAVQKQISDMIHAEASQILKTDLRKVTLSAAGFSPATGQAGPGGVATSGARNAAEASATPATGALAPARHPENWSQVEDVYFRAYWPMGVGGMITIDYEPLVFFKDGTYYEVEEEAIEDMDLAASRRARPNKWGRWTRSGNAFTLINAKGQSSREELQDGSFFKAFPAEAAGNRLAAGYKRVSGGGNSALGGEMTIMAQTNLSFAADGRYTRASSGGAIGSGSMTGVATSAYSNKPSAGVGRYRIERHTITLTEPDGQPRRQFFAVGSEKTPPRPDTDLIFIGDRVFVVDD